MALTKTDIVNSVKENLGFSKQRSAEIIESLLEIMKESLESGDDVMISGFGKFCFNEKKERVGRNPAIDKEMILPKRRVVTFKCSGKLRDKINKKKRR